MGGGGGEGGGSPGVFSGDFLPGSLNPESHTSFSLMPLSDVAWYQYIVSHS